jgi:ferric-dicitrate binding protein FerR (iron transport regulator)
LPDGTAVKLNSGSSVQFPEHFYGDTREVKLNGEAYFEVVRDVEKPFIVHTEQARTTVVGTSFNIKSLQGSLTEVTLVEGKVRVTSSHISEGNWEEVTLDPNQQAIIETGSSTITTRKVDALRYIAWKDNVLEFENTSLESAVEGLKKWYGVEIELKNAERSTCTISATYRNESLENVLKSFEYTLKIDYTFQDGKVIIDSKKCQ